MNWFRSRSDGHSAIYEPPPIDSEETADLEFAYVTPDIIANSNVASNDALEPTTSSKGSK